jgi:hypothetical protein
MRLKRLGGSAGRLPLGPGSAGSIWCEPSGSCASSAPSSTLTTIGVEGVGAAGAAALVAALSFFVRSMARCTCGGMRWKYNRLVCARGKKSEEERSVRGSR